MLTRYVHRIVLLIVLVLTGAGVSYVQAVIHEGTCGAPGNEENVTWKVDTEYQSLVINGTGPMQDYSPASPAPWASYNSYYDRVAFNTDVTNVGEYAFYNCQNITYVFINSAILSIGRNAFDGCTALRYVNIPSSITSIGEEAFQNCDALQAIYASWTTAGDLPTWTNMTNKNHSTLKLYIPCETAGIYEAASGWNNYVNMFETPVVERKTCGPNATYVLSCDSVLTISGTGSMYNSAYVGDKLSIKHVIIEDGITGIGYYIFTYCTNLVSVSIPSSVTSIGYSAFRGCPALTSVTIPSSVTSIGQYAFRDCNNLTDIYVSWTETAKIPTWNNMTNKSPQSDITLHVPCGSANIYEAKANWTDYTIDGGPGGTCGASGDNLTWMLCDSVLTISGTGAMANTWAVATVPWAAYKDEITSVVVNAGVTVIGQYAFAQCANLQSVSLPEGLTAIRASAFRECSSLTSFTIPNSVTSLGYDVFDYTPLEDIYVSWTTSSFPSGYDLTNYATSSIRLHIPCGTSANYLAKIGWKEYALRSDCTEEYTLTVQSNNPTIGVVQIDDGEVGVSASLQVKKDETHFIKAFANDACHIFQKWSDNNTGNPRSVAITANTTYTAQFTDRSAMSGACGTYATWVLSCDSVLTISGTGDIWNQAFQSKSYSSAIKHVIIEEGIESIETNAFRGCANLVSVQNPSTLRRIRDYAFMNCQKLDTINFPEGLITIGSSPTSDGHTFYECNSLRSIHIPASVTNISKDCFLRCYSVTSIVVDKANTKYDSRDNCNAIIEKTNNKLWYGCRNTVIPDGVVTIADYAFEYQHNLKSIRISNTVTSFGYYVFKECENLKDIYVEWTENIPNYVITQWQQHLNLDQTIRVHVPCGKAALYEAIYNWNKFQIVDDHVKGGMCGAQGANLTWMLSCDSVLTISGTGEMMEDYYGLMPWYSHRTSISSIVIKDGVTSIGFGAFYQHSKLTSVTIPPSVTTINSESFHSTMDKPVYSLYITDLTAWCNVDIPHQTGAPFYSSYDSLEAGNLYVNGTKVTTLTIPDGITEMKDNTFYGCTSITSIQFNHATTIGAFAFAACHGLTSVTIPEGVTTIKRNAFAACKNLQSISIPTSVTSLATKVLYNCQALTDIYVHWTEGVPDWPSDFTTKSPQSSITLHVPCGTKTLYKSKTGWKNYTIVEDVASAHEAVWSNISWSLSICDSILTLSGTGNMPDITSASNQPWKDYRTAIKSVIIEDGITDIARYAFHGCSNLISVTIPSSVTSLGLYAFQGCTQLPSITIPSSITSVGNGSLTACDALTDIYVEWPADDIPTCPSQLTNKGKPNLHVPCEAIDTYKTKTGWKNYNVVGGVIYTVTVETDDAIMGTVDAVKL